MDSTNYDDVALSSSRGQSNHETESFLLENSKLVSLVDALKFFGGWDLQKEELPKSLNSRFGLRRSAMPHHKLKSDEFMKTVLHKKAHGGHIVEVLVKLGITSEQDIVVELTKHHKFPYLPLKYYDINPEAVKAVPEDLAREYLLVPLDKVEDNLMIAMVNPLDKQAILEVEIASSCYVQVFLSTLSEVLSAIENKYIRSSDEIF